VSVLHDLPLGTKREKLKALEKTFDDAREELATHQKQPHR
jgi:hypothetical protein